MISLVQENDLFFGNKRFLTARWDFYRQWTRVHKHYSFHWVRNIGTELTLSLEQLSFEQGRCTSHVN
jgi:hypothetical protein